MTPTHALPNARLVRALCLLAAFAASPSPAPAQTTNPYNSLKLLWVAPGDDGNQGQVSGYEVGFKTSPFSSDTLNWWNEVPSAQKITIGPPLASAGAADSTTVAGLTPGTHYYFIVRAFDDWYNRSAFSNVADDTTWTCSAPGAMPSSFAAVPSTGQVALSWGTTTDPLALAVHVYRATGSGSFSQIQSLPAGATNYTDTSVSGGVTYRYRAAYSGVATCEGPSTAILAVTVPSPAPAPGAAASASSIHVYPNPASGSLRVVLDNGASSSMPVYLRLYDLNGHWIATLADATYPPGTTEVPWNRVGRDGRPVGAGYYELLGTVGLTKVRERLVLLP